MLRAALRESGLEDNKEVIISPFEARSGRVVYSWETILHFRRLHPGAPLYFLMGSDCLSGFGKWRRRDVILKNARLLVGLRPGHSMTPGAVPFTRLRGRFPEADSSALRTDLFLGLRPAQLHRAVWALAEKKSFYLARERSLLKKILSPRRYAHTLDTAALAVKLAPGAGVPLRQAALASLLHDCARDLSPAAVRRLCPPGTPLLRQILKEAPVLAHAWAGAELARRKFGVEDPEVLGAIRTHATGAPGMGALSRLVYVSDLANTGRKFREAALVRKLAFLDFDEAFKAANYVKLVYAFSGAAWVHPLSIKLWNSLQEKKNG
jgi:predicted HD superfamily hydrolase involved in NAD metabolism